MPEPYWPLYFSTSGEVQGTGTGPAGLGGAAGLAGSAEAGAARSSAAGFFSPSGGGGGTGVLTSSAMPGSVVIRYKAIRYKSRASIRKPSLLTGGCGHRQ